MRRLYTAFWLLTLGGCSVESEVRCDGDELACPSGSYCGGVWCYPNHRGPDPRDPDAVDAGDDMRHVPDMAGDMVASIDMAPLVDMAPPLVDMAPPVDMAPVDMAPPPVDMAPPPVDMAPPPVDMAPPPVDMPPVDMAPPPVDMAPPPVDMAPPPVDMAPPPVDMALDMTPPVDMAPDMLPLDMLPPDIGPDEPPPPPDVQLSLGEVLPRDAWLSTSEAQDRDRLRMTIEGAVPDGDRTLHVSIVPVPQGADPVTGDVCVSNGNPRRVTFAQGAGVVSINVETYQDWRIRNAHFGRIATCVKSFNPARTQVIVQEVWIDADPPRFDIRPIETNADRTSGIMPVVVVSAEEDWDFLNESPPIIYRDADCLEPDDRFGVPVRQPMTNEFRYLIVDQAEGATIEAFLGAEDSVGNRVCLAFESTLDAGPTASTIVECVPGAQSTIYLQFQDDRNDEVRLEGTDEMASSCREINEADQVGNTASIALHCEPCELLIDLEDELGAVRRTVLVRPSRFATPWRLSHRPADALDNQVATSATRAVLQDVSAIIITGFQRFTEWTQGPRGFQGQSNLNLSSVVARGDFVGSPGEELYVGNVAHGANRFSSRGCRGLVMPQASIDPLMSQPLDQRDACLAAGGGFIRQIEVGRFNEDEFDDVVVRDNRGWIDLVRGGPDTMDVRTEIWRGGAPEDRQQAIDVALVASQPSSMVIALEEHGVEWVLDLMGRPTNVRFLNDQQIRCVAPVDWNQDGVEEVALCLGRDVVIMAFEEGQLREVVRMRGVPEGTHVVDLAFQRQRPFPIALTVNSVGQVFQTRPAMSPRILDLPESIARIFPLDERGGFDVLLRSTIGARVYALQSAPLDHIHRVDRLPDMPAVVRSGTPRLAADYTANFRDELVYERANQELGVLELDGNTWDFIDVRGIADEDRLPTTGDFDGDGRIGPAAIRRTGPAHSLTVGTDPPPDAQNPRVPLTTGINLTGPAWGLAIGPLLNQPQDMMAVGVGESIQLFNAGPAGQPAPLVPFIDLPRAADHLVIARFGNMQRRALVAFFNTADGFDYAAYALDGPPDGAQIMIDEIAAGSVPGQEVVEVFALGVEGRRQILLHTDPFDEMELIHQVHHMSGVGGPGMTRLYNGRINFMAAGDVDGDLRQDFVIAADEGRDAWQVRTFSRRMNDLPAEAPEERFGFPRFGPTIIGLFVGDFNGDRVPDRLVIAVNGMAFEAHLLTYGSPENAP